MTNSAAARWAGRRRVVSERNMGRPCAVGVADAGEAIPACIVPVVDSGKRDLNKGRTR